MKIYLASRFKNKASVRKLAEELRKKNHQVLCSWIDESEGCNPVDAARRDISEICYSDTLVVLTEGCELVSGGMHFETGYATALGHLVYVVGPVVNIFHNLFRSFPTVEEFLKFIGPGAA